MDQTHQVTHRKMFRTSSVKSPACLALELRWYLFVYFGNVDLCCVSLKWLRGRSIYETVSWSLWLFINSRKSKQDCFLLCNIDVNSRVWITADPGEMIYCGQTAVFQVCIEVPRLIGNGSRDSITEFDTFFFFSATETCSIFPMAF